MFQFAGLPPRRLCIQRRVTRVSRAGFPHSDIPGSLPAGGSPKLFAANHVLRRPIVPRHPPCALRSFITQRIARFSSASCSTVKVPTIGCVSAPGHRAPGLSPSSALAEIGTRPLGTIRRSGRDLMRIAGRGPRSAVEPRGFEPLTPCLQSRCSPAELRPRASAVLHNIRETGSGTLDSP